MIFDCPPRSGAFSLASSDREKCVFTVNNAKFYGGGVPYGQGCSLWSGVFPMDGGAPCGGATPIGNSPVGNSEHRQPP